MPWKKYWEQGHNQGLFLKDQDLSVKDQDKDKNLSSKDQDFKFVLEDSLRTRTRTRTTTLHSQASSFVAYVRGFSFIVVQSFVLFLGCSYNNVLPVPVNWLAGKIVSEMTYNVSRWRLNPTILITTVILTPADWGRTISRSICKGRGGRGVKNSWKGGETDDRQKCIILYCNGKTVIVAEAVKLARIKWRKITGINCSSHWVAYREPTARPCKAELDQRLATVVSSAVTRGRSFGVCKKNYCISISPPRTEFLQIPYLAGKNYTPVLGLCEILDAFLRHN